MNFKPFNIRGKRSTLISVFFSFIFLVYFASAAGLYNSMDATQFFTTEALLKNQNVDLTPVSNDPHFFVYPDVYYKDEEVLSVRGYMTSVLASPLYVGAKYLADYQTVENFDEQVYTNTNFKHELLVSSLFSIFTVLGLYGVFLTLESLSKNLAINLFVTSLLAFGSYAWKYANAYTRHPEAFMLLAFAIYGFYTWYYHRNKVALFIFFVTIALSFGVDMFLFASLCLGAVLLVFPKVRLPEIRQLIKISIIPLVIIVLNVVLNYIYYSTLFFSQTTEQYTIKEIVGEENTSKVWFSTELLPAGKALLFNTGRLSEEVFSNLEVLPEEVGTFISAPFARRYEFYGLFAVSPVFLLSFLIIFLKKERKIYGVILFFSSIIFLAGVLMNAKVLNFWGGNQYDIRYIYSYSVVFAIPLQIVIRKFVNRKKILKLTGFLLLAGTSLFSFFMGWLGVLNMFRSALTGERKIWADFSTIPSIFREYTVDDFIAATFPNRENLILGITLVLMFNAALFLVRYLLGSSYQNKWKESLAK